MLLDTLRRTLRSFDPPLIWPGDRVLVAVSGGPDSLSLLHALITLKEELGLDAVLAAHLDHGFRGDESAADAAFVRAWCAERSVPCRIGFVDVAQLAEQARESRQHAARNARYSFLDGVAGELRANCIATAHTQDDRIETTLLNMLRGTGIEGLKGIPYRRDAYVRPMLDVTRSEVLSYCEEHNLTPRIDPSNFATDHYTRNKVRLELLPLLERDYNPGVRTAILRLSEIAARDVDFLQAQAADSYAAVILERSDGHVVLDNRRLRALDPAILRYVVIKAAGDLRGSASGLSFDLIESVCAAIATSPPSPFGINTPPPHCAIRVTQRRAALRLVDMRAG